MIERRAKMGLLALGLFSFGCGADIKDDGTSDSNGWRTYGSTTTTTTTTTSSSTTTAPTTTTGSAASVGVGDSLYVDVDTNPTTGFEWVIQSPKDAAVLELVSREYTPDKSASMVGAGGTERITWRAVAVGNTTILMFYQRPKGDEKPQQEYRLDVVVE